MFPHELANLIFGPSLAFLRISSLVMVLPFMGMGVVPSMVRIGFAAALSAIVVPLIGAPMPPVPGSIVVLAFMILREVLIGLVLGWLTAAILMSLPVAGQIISYQMGLSSVLLPNSEVGANSTLLANAFSIILPALIFVSGIYLLPVMAIVRSFRTIPLSGALISGNLPTAGLALSLASQVVTGEFLTAVHLVAPFLFIGLIWQAGLGLMAKASPNLQIFFVAAPVQLLGGMALLAVLATPMIVTWQDAVVQLIRAYALW